MDKKSDYGTPIYLRFIVVITVLILAVLTTLAVPELAELIGADITKLQGAGFEPTFKVMTVVIIYSASQFLLIWLVMLLVHKRPFASLGFDRPIIAPLLIGTGIGIVLQAIEVSLLVLFGSDASLATNVPSGTSFFTVFGYFALWLFFLLTLNSLKEELVFRAYPIEQFNDYPGYMIPIIIAVSLVFSAVHHVIEPFTLSAFISRFLIALLFCYVYYRSRSIWLVAGIHNGVNFLGFLLGGSWKSGGLLHLSLEYPSETISIGINVFITAIALAGFYLYWRKKPII
jgi:membrane protease YdiL (CAAX protease family)